MLQTLVKLQFCYGCLKSSSPLHMQSKYQLSPCNTTSTHMDYFLKHCPNTHPLILPALLRSRRLCKPQITDWDAKGWSWRLEYSRGLKGTKGSIQLPQIPRYVCTQTQGDPRIIFWNEQPPASAWYSGPNSCPLSTPSSCKKTPQTQVSAGQTQQDTRSNNQVSTHLSELIPVNTGCTSSEF